MSIVGTVLAGLDPELDGLMETYKQLRRHPELAFQEHETSKRVADKLAVCGYSVQDIGGTGVVGVLANGDGPTVLSRADMDVLTVTEGTGLPYASEVDGVMHACGHLVGEGAPSFTAGVNRLECVGLLWFSINIFTVSRGAPPIDPAK